MAVIAIILSVVIFHFIINVEQEPPQDGIGNWSGTVEGIEIPEFGYIEDVTNATTRDILNALDETNGNVEKTIELLNSPKN